MAQNQRKYGIKYKVQAIKPSEKISAVKVTSELGIPVNTLYGWQKAVREQQHKRVEQASEKSKCF